MKSGEKVVLNRVGWELLIYSDGTYRMREIPAADIAQVNSLLAIAREGGQLDPELKTSPGSMIATRFDAADGFMLQALWNSMYVADATAPRNFAGTYSGGFSGTDNGFAWSGSFSVGINDLAGAFQVNSVNIAGTSGITTPFALVGSGNLGTVSSDGGFNLNATLGSLLSDWGGSSGWTAADNVTINGQTNGKDMNLNINGTHNLGALTGSGTGSK